MCITDLDRDWETKYLIKYSTYQSFDISRLSVVVGSTPASMKSVKLQDLFSEYSFNPVAMRHEFSKPKRYEDPIYVNGYIFDISLDPYGDNEPQILTFPLENLSNIRDLLLKQPLNTEILIDDTWPIPLQSALKTLSDLSAYSKQFSLDRDWES